MKCLVPAHATATSRFAESSSLRARSITRFVNPAYYFVLKRHCGSSFSTTLSRGRNPDDTTARFLPNSSVLILVVCSVPRQNKLSNKHRFIKNDGYYSIFQLKICLLLFWNDLQRVSEELQRKTTQERWRSPRCVRARSIPSRYGLACILNTPRIFLHRSFY